MNRFFTGGLVTQKYPSGRVVPVSYDSGGRISQVGATTGKVFADSFKHAADNSVEEVRLGNGLWEQTRYNVRRQPESVKLGTTKGASDRWQIANGYGPVNGNNGNVRTQTIIAPAVGTLAAYAAVRTYTYDHHNRLQSVRETRDTATGPESWKQAFKFDRYGNRAVAGSAADPASNIRAGYGRAYLPYALERNARRGVGPGAI